MDKILVVDDDPALARALAVRLQSAGFVVEVCTSAHDAATAAVHGHPSVIILDVDMPGYTGPELHQCLGFTHHARHIPVIYLTGHDSEWNRRIAAEQGAAAFVTKPYDPDELVGIIRSVDAAGGAPESPVAPVTVPAARS